MEFSLGSVMELLRLELKVALPQGLPQRAPRHPTKSRSWAKRLLVPAIKQEGIALSASFPKINPQEARWGNGKEETRKKAKEKASPAWQLLPYLGSFSRQEEEEPSPPGGPPTPLPGTEHSRKCATKPPGGTSGPPDVLGRNDGEKKKRNG
ncbi:uncharacterized protein LOC142074017 isoform X3 [Calonectris borealis]|uniref:uncharacterized protein LOC142074017 isoform X3 n=1 Tax=Calonectris borealis TaxID=1323832 RepID=UPI003F4B174C